VNKPEHLHELINLGFNRGRKLNRYLVYIEGSVSPIDLGFYSRL